MNLSKLGSSGIAVAVVLLLATGARTQSFPLLQLDEVFSYAVPDSLPVTGVDRAHTGSLVIWGKDQPFLILLLPSQQIISHDSLVEPVGAALISGDSIVEVIDGRRRALLRLTASGHLIESLSIVTLEDIQHARRTANGWIITTTDGNHIVRVGQLRSDGEITTLHTILPFSGSAVPQQVSVAGVGDGALISMIEDPFDAWLLRYANKSLLKFEPARLPLPSPGNGAPAPLWIALSLLPLDHGFVRTFADIRSDLRFLTLYDESGRYIRGIPLNTSFGVVTTTPDDQLLIAVRRSNFQEIVGYRWRWSTDQ